MVIFLFVLAVIGHAAATDYTVVVRTASVQWAGTDDIEITLTLEGKGGNTVTHGYLDNVGVDDFQSGATDTFTFSDDINIGTLKFVNITVGSDDGWKLDWLSVETDKKEARYVYNTESLWMSSDSDDGDGAAVAEMDLQVAGSETYYLVIETANKTDAGSDSIHVKAIIHGTADAKTGYLDNADVDDFVAGENDVFIVPGMVPAGKLQCLTLFCEGDDAWSFDWVVVFSVKSYSQSPRVFWNNGTVLSSDDSEGVKEYYVCRNDNQWGSTELIELV